MRYNDLGHVLDTNIERWTESAYECYLNGLNCKICTIPNDLKENCRMKPCVLELVKKFGVPK